EDADRRAHNVYYPFDNKKQWALARFLSENLTQTQIETFLKLDLTKDMALGSCFKSALKLRDAVESLPGGPEWKLVELNLKGYTTKKPIRLLYRDGLEAVRHLFGNPVFAHHMEFDGVYDEVLQGGRRQKEYSEFCTADYFKVLN
ncbi:hypothetical protein DXG01_016358, partial [Tephrocybe rancida]